MNALGLALIAGGSLLLLPRPSGSPMGDLRSTYASWGYNQLAQKRAELVSEQQQTGNALITAHIKLIDEVMSGKTPEPPERQYQDQHGNVITQAQYEELVRNAERERLAKLAAEEKARFEAELAQRLNAMKPAPAPQPAGPAPEYRSAAETFGTSQMTKPVAPEQPVQSSGFNPAWLLLAAVPFLFKDGA